MSAYGSMSVRNTHRRPTVQGWSFAEVSAFSKTLVDFRGTSIVVLDPYHLVY